jgi:nitroreductase / dihydropteridine reductase
MNIENNIKQSLATRYTSKSFEPNKKINDEHYNIILESINMAPTSFGLQPFKIIEVRTQEQKDAILPIAFNQAQINTCDSILVFAVEKDLDIALDQYINRIITNKRQDEAGANGFKQYVKGFLVNMSSKSSNALVEWSSKQAYIALGYASMTAAMLGVETACMEGFNPQALDEYLGLEAKGLKSVVMLTIGVGAEVDANKTNPKVRKNINELVIS